MGISAFQPLDEIGQIGLQVRRAGWLDIPFLFEQILDGCMSGSFSERYLAGSGLWKLFVFLIDAVTLRGAWMPGCRPKTCIGVITKDGRSVGFYQLDIELTAANNRILTIVLFSVDASCRNQGLAREVLTNIVKSQPPGTEIIAYCTKYARAMQRVLHQLHFSRGKTQLSQLTRFSLALT